MHAAYSALDFKDAVNVALYGSDRQIERIGNVLKKSAGPTDEVAGFEPRRLVDVDLWPTVGCCFIAQVDNQIRLSSSMGHPEI
jgi:hypothetical protein